MVPSLAGSAVFLLVSFATATSEPHPLSDEFIDLINMKQNSWKAGRNFAANTPMSYIKRLAGVIKSDRRSALPVREHDAALIASLPDSFDPREHWPQCPSLAEIQDQGGCGSCWAFGAVEAMTDRICIHSNGNKKVHISAQDLVSCSYGGNCNGGDPGLAWIYWTLIGIVSGGSYNSSEGCMPYLIAPCAHHIVEPPLPPCDINTTPKCENKCESNYDVDYLKDKQYGIAVHSFQGESDIQAELFKNGPAETDFSVYEDFLHYKKGVYKHTQGNYTGAHAVKLLGWGVEGGQKYWLVANSWNSGWGDKGFFKILRGVNECGIEANVIAGEPWLD